MSGESEEVRERIGFVDQEDNLLGTMTVFESVLLSAVLRLPDNMPLAAKAARVMRVLKDLRLSHVADSYVGSKTKRYDQTDSSHGTPHPPPLIRLVIVLPACLSGRYVYDVRGISGGEKRRVMVAMELVKVPSVLLLDEPTSGLDAFNANLLVTCLKDLAARKATNVIMTIHQPRSNIFTSFDRLLVINQGEVTYHGSIEDVAGFFHSIGRPIPAVYNPADYLIDVLFEKEIAALEGAASPSSLKLLCSPAVQSTAIDVAASPVLPPKGTSQDQHHDDDETKDEPMGVELTATKASSLPPLAGSPARQAVERAELGATTKGKSDDDMTMGMSTSNGSGGATNGEPANPLALKFKESDVARAVQQEVLDTLRWGTGGALEGGSGGADAVWWCCAGCVWLQEARGGRGGGCEERRCGREHWVGVVHGAAAAQPPPHAGRHFFLLLGQHGQGHDWQPGGRHPGHRHLGQGTLAEEESRGRRQLGVERGAPVPAVLCGGGHALQEDHPGPHPEPPPARITHHRRWLLRR